MRMIIIIIIIIIIIKIINTDWESCFKIDYLIRF